MLNRITNYEIGYMHKEYTLQELHDISSDIVTQLLYDITGHDITDTKLGKEVLEQYKMEN